MAGETAGVAYNLLILVLVIVGGIEDWGFSVFVGYKRLILWPERGCGLYQWRGFPLLGLPLTKFILRGRGTILPGILWV